MHAQAQTLIAPIAPPVRPSRAVGLAAGLLLATALGTGPAAGQVTAADADAAERAIKEWIDTQLLGGAPGAVLDFGPGLEVVAQGDRLVGSMPAGRLLIEAEGTVVTVAMTEQGFTAVPTEQGRYQVSAALPREWVISAYPDTSIDTLGDTSAPETEVTITIGGQSIDLLFDPAYQASLTSEMELLDITMSDNSADFMGAIAAVTAVSDSVPTGESPHHFDQSTDFRVAGIDISGPEARIAIDEITIGAIAQNTDLSGFRTFLEEFQAVQAEINAAPNDPQVMTRMLDVLAMLPELFDGFTYGQEMRGFTAEAEGVTVTLDHQSFDLSLTGLSDETSEVGFGFGLSDLAIEPALPESGLLPGDVAIDLAIAELPNEAIGAAFNRFVSSAMAIGPERAGPMMALELYSAAVDAGTMVDLRQLLYRTGIGEIRIDSIVHPDTAATYGVTATADFTVETMDAFAEEVRDWPWIGEGISQAILALKAVGDPVADGGHQFSFELTRDGMMLINGQDLMDVLDMR